MAIPTNLSSTSTQTVSTHVCSGRHKLRLLVGEGNFSFALALILKHDTKAQHNAENSLAHSVIATELKSEVKCEDCKNAKFFEEVEVRSPDVNRCCACIKTQQRIEELRKKGAQVLLGVDGTKLNEQFGPTGKKFERIHWNCPHDGSQYGEQTLPEIISEFFKSCARIQNAESRVHITLAQPPGKEAFYQGVIYNIVKASCVGGYVLFKKRKFDHNRYPGYQHVKTWENSTADVTKEGMREFVFKKVSQELFAQGVKNARVRLNVDKVKVDTVKFVKTIQKETDKPFVLNSKPFNMLYNRFFIECDTDEDSSDYESPLGN